MLKAGITDKNEIHSFKIKRTNQKEEGDQQEGEGLHRG
jgi:hypothetical protein